MKEIFHIFVLAIYLLGWLIVTEALISYLEAKNEQISVCFFAGLIWPVLLAIVFALFLILALLEVCKKVAIKIHKKIQSKLDKIFE